MRASRRPDCSAKLALSRKIQCGEEAQAMCWQDRKSCDVPRYNHTLRTGGYSPILDARSACDSNDWRRNFSK